MTATEHADAPGPEPRVEVRPIGHGRAEVRVKIGQTTVASDTCNANSAQARARCLKALRVQSPLVDDDLAADIERALVDLPPDAPAASSDRTATQGRALQFETVEPWPDPVDGAVLLDEIAATIGRYVVVVDGAREAVALWTLHTYALDAAEVTPRLGIVSPEPRCGKSTLLALLDALVHRPLAIENVTAAALFRTVEIARPTLLVDEADSYLTGKGANDELRGILNAGHARGGSVLRCVGDEAEPRMFGVFAPVAIALIGRLPATIEDRSILLRMRRQARGERAERLRRSRICAELLSLRQRCARWVSDHRDRLAAAEPIVPAELGDRATDNWRPLLGIADLAGGQWPERARAAARTLCAGAGTDELSVGVMLLADLRDMFKHRQVDRLPTDDILRTLTTRDDRPWPEWRRGQPLTARGLAKLLGPFRVRPRSIRLRDGSTPKGYVLDDLQDAFDRYLDPDPPDPSATPPHAASEADSRVSGSATDRDGVADAFGARTACEAGCGGVADGQGVGAEEEDFPL